MILWIDLETSGLDEVSVMYLLVFYKLNVRYF
jgi:hypothetical protein